MGKCSDFVFDALHDWYAKAYPTIRSACFEEGFCSSVLHPGDLRTFVTARDPAARFASGG